MAKQNKYTPSDIAAGTMMFNIPLYQRLFAWKTKQVSVLLNDLQEHFEKTSDDSTNPPYYLGMLTCINDGSTYDLIDGQQRFTVMMLLAICLKEIEPDNNPWNAFLLNGDKPRLSFFAREEDQDYLVDKIYSSTQSKYNNADMEAAIDCIKAFLTKLGSEEKQRVFSDNVFKRLTFFISELPESYKKQPASLNKYFEAMNAQGKSLEQHEILKVELMRHSPHQEEMTRIWNLVCQTNKTVLSKEENQSEEDYRNKYLEAIQNCRSGNFQYLIEKTRTDSTDKYTIDTIKAQKHNFENRFSGDGDSSIISFSELLLIALDIERGVDSEGYDVNKLLTKFHNLEGAFDVWHFYQTLLLTRLILDYYVVRREVINGQGDFTLIIHDAEKTPEQLRQYQAMLAVSTDSLSWLRSYIKLLITRDYTTHELLLNIKAIDNQKHSIVPSVSELKYGVVDRYWFWRLDYYLWLKRDLYFDEKYVDAVSRYIFRRNRSIEHLHPQNEDNNTGDLWPEESIHMFGNLAMISQGFNSEQSNDNLELKFARIREQLQNKSLQSLKLLKMYCDANGSGVQWTQEIARVHQDEMIRILNDSYSD